jgi:hypothetical protein
MPSDICHVTGKKENPKPKKIDPKPIGKEPGTMAIRNREDKGKK